MCAFILNTKSTEEGLIWHKFILNIWALIPLNISERHSKHFPGIVQENAPTLFYLLKLFTKIWI